MSSPSIPLVSVVIPLFNKRQHIESTIQSVLAQDFKDYEIVVVDDGSTDGSGEAASCYLEHIRYTRQANAGPSAARNRGIDLSRGKYVAFLDGDDRWMPDKLSRQVDFMTSHPSLRWSATSYRTIVADKVKLEPDTVERPREQSSWVVVEDWFVHNTKTFKILTSGVMVQRNVLMELGGFDVNIPAGQDMDLWMRIARAYPSYGFCEKPLFDYHRGIKGSIGRSGRRKYESIVSLLEGHVRDCLGEYRHVKSYELFLRWDCPRIVRIALARGFPDLSRRLYRTMPNHWIRWKDRFCLLLTHLPGGLLRWLATMRLNLLGKAVNDPSLDD